jgi:beta-N-acetylhexosaminidase
MTAHVVYAAIDPIAPATTSVTVVGDVIRGWMGFRGLLMSDDISMGALSGPITARSHAAIAAGCDVVLHCNGKLDEMQEVASAVPRLAGEAEVRADAALRLRTCRSGEAVAALRAEWAMLTGMTAAERRAIS